MTVFAPTAAVILVLAASVVLLSLAVWRRERRYRRELSDRDASYRALLEINVRHYRDIAERDARYRELLEEAREGVIAVVDSKVVFANRAAQKMFRLSREEDWIGKNILDFVAPESWEAIQPAAERGADETFPYRREIIAVRPDGSRFNLEFTPAAMSYEGKAAMQAVLRDITERRRAEEALRQAEERYRLLFESNPQPMWVYAEKSLRFLAVNEAACNQYGYSREEFLTMTIADIRPAEDIPAMLAAVAATIGSDSGSPGVWRHRKKDGTLIDVEINFHSLPFGGVPARLVVAYDVTERQRAEEERRRLEEQLLQSQKMEAVGQLAGGIAHDFNNLLTAIAGYSELLLGELRTEDTRRGYAEEIRRAGERAASLTQQLLAFSRRQMLDQKVFDLNEVVGSIETMFGRLLGEHIEMRTSKATDLWRIKADPGQIEHAIVNLAINARDAMPDGGKLTIETGNVWLDGSGSPDQDPAKAGPYASIVVTDTGIGMTSEVKTHLYEPFFTTKERGKGTGLGLSTTYGIIKQSGGHIESESEPGRGTIFKVYLPRAEEAAEPAPAPGSALHPGSETVLLVEDEPEVRGLVQRILKSQGYTVVTAANPDEALAVSRVYKGRIEIMVTDVVMPGMSGRQLAERLALSRPEMRVLFVSGYTDDAVIQHGFGTAVFLQKPFTPTALARKVREVLEASPT